MFTAELDMEENKKTRQTNILNHWNAVHCITGQLYVITVRTIMRTIIIQKTNMDNLYMKKQMSKHIWVLHGIYY